MNWETLPHIHVDSLETIDFNLNLETVACYHIFEYCEYCMANLQCWVTCVRLVWPWTTKCFWAADSATPSWNTQVRTTPVQPACCVGWHSTWAWDLFGSRGQQGYHEPVGMACQEKIKHLKWNKFDVATSFLGACLYKRRHRDKAKENPRGLSISW